MTDKKSTGKVIDKATEPTPPVNNSSIPAGVTEAEQEQAEADARSARGKKADLPDDPTLVKKLPEGAAEYSATTLPAANGPTMQTPFASAYDDDHRGKGGTFIVGDDGVRRPAFEKVTDEDGKELGFRPIK